MPPDTDVVVVGGGATGCGVARDLAMRGVGVTLVERGSLAGGTTGRSHGVLHSGARYADVDPDSAVACREERQVLARIAGEAVRETGGSFVTLSGDDDGYHETKLEACRACGIEATPIDGAELHDRVPAVAEDAVRGIAVPDAVVFPSRLVAATAASAVDHGATILTGRTVTGLAVERDGVTVDLADDEGRSATIGADQVVNAAGAWAGRVAALADVDLTMAPTRGLMVALAFDGLETVLNRCRPPSDGDIAVPHGAEVLCGTTSVPIEDPDEPDGTGEEVEAVRSECATMLPALADASVRRTFWGVRPLYAPGGRAATRGFQVLDHDDRDGVPGLTSVVGGKLTTHRLMAERVADRVASRLGVDEPSRTADRPLPGHDDASRLDALVRRFRTAGPADEGAVDAHSP